MFPLKPHHQAATSILTRRTAFAPRNPLHHTPFDRAGLQPLVLGGLNQFSMKQLLNNSENQSINSKHLTCFPITSLSPFQKDSQTSLTVEKLNKPVKSILRNHQELIATGKKKKNLLLIKRKQNNHLGTVGILQQ